MTLRNTPDADCNVSPAQILFGHPLRDSLLFSSRLQKYSYPQMSKTWRDAWRPKEDALRTRYIRNSEYYDSRSRNVRPLQIGDRCFVQNCRGNHPKKWGLSGTVVRKKRHHKYEIKLDGSGRLTTRNRRQLRKFMPMTTSIAGKRELRPIALPAARPNLNRNPEALQEECQSPVLVPGSENATSPLVLPESHQSPARPTHSATECAPKKIPLALRRLKDFNEPGPKQEIQNPLGRRAPFPDNRMLRERDEE